MPPHLEPESQVGQHAALFVDRDGKARGWMVGRPGRGILLADHAASLDESIFKTLMHRDARDGTVVACSADRRQARIALQGRAEKLWVDVPERLVDELHVGAHILALLHDGRVVDWSTYD